MIVESIILWHIYQVFLWLLLHCCPISWLVSLLFGYTISHLTKVLAATNSEPGLALLVGVSCPWLYNKEKKNSHIWHAQHIQFLFDLFKTCKHHKVSFENFCSLEVVCPCLGAMYMYRIMKNSDDLCAKTELYKVCKISYSFLITE